MKENKLVLFTGTPCQIAGLKKYLKKDYEKLCTCDVICHGVASKNVFNEYIKILSKKYRRELKEISFRSKENGQNSTMQINFKNKKYIKSYCYDIFGVLFNNGFIMRDSCYSCEFANKNRVADITMGDFWNVEKLKLDIETKKGVSMVLINTEKGKKIFERLENIKTVPVSIEECINIQEQLRFPINKNKLEEKFWEQFLNKNREKVVKKFSRTIINRNYLITILIRLKLLKLVIEIKNSFCKKSKP